MSGLLDPISPNDDDGVIGLLTDTMAQPAVSTALPVTSDAADVPATSAAATSAVVATTTPVEPIASSTVPTSAISSVPSSVPVSSTILSVAPTTTSTSSSVIPSTTTTSTTPTTTSTTPTSTRAASTVVVTRTAVSQPALVTPSSVASKSASVSAAKATETAGKGGIGGSGLPLGGLVGIIIGVLAIVAVVGLLVTRSMRKRARARRTANRSSLFEPWPAPAPVSLEDEPYEKPGYDAPSQSYPMHPAGGAYAEPGYGAQYAHEQQEPLTYEGQPQAGYDQYSEYPPQAYGQQAYPPQSYQPEMAGVAAGVGAGAAAVTASAAGGHGLVDGSMVRVKVAFVRSLEDELAITPGQQLYLHQVYDDGWTLCEDQAQNRGVVPLSCLEPWVEQGGIVTSPSDQALSANATTQRRSSLYVPPSGGYQQ